MNDSKNSSKGLLVLKSEQHLNQEQMMLLVAQIEPLAERLGLEPVVVPYGFDVEVKTDNEALLERVCVALETLVAQGTPPSISLQEEAPQALNARPVYDGRNGNGYQPLGNGLNTRPPRGR
jgi:hypothetical protein